MLISAEKQMKSFNRKSDLEVRFWYDMSEKYFSRDCEGTKFCEQEGVDYKILKNWIYRLNPWQQKYSGSKEEELNQYKRMIESTEPSTIFCKKKWD